MGRRGGWCQNRIFLEDRSALVAAMATTKLATAARFYSHLSSRRIEGTQKCPPFSMYRVPAVWPALSRESDTGHHSECSPGSPAGVLLADTTGNVPALLEVIG